MTRFDDFLGLTDRDLTPFRVIAFHGRSGSGKSTAIQFVLDHHFRGRPVQMIEGPPFQSFLPRASGEESRLVIVIDEIASVRDLLSLRNLFRSDATVLAATHVSPLFFRALAARRLAVFHTDRDPSKIARHLESRGVAASPAAVREYVRLFGATYTDAKLIMERYPSRDFDRSLARFLKFDRLELAPSPKLISSSALLE